MRSKDDIVDLFSSDNRSDIWTIDREIRSGEKWLGALPVDVREQLGASDAEGRLSRLFDETHTRLADLLKGEGPLAYILDIARRVKHRVAIFDPVLAESPKRVVLGQIGKKIEGSGLTHFLVGTYGFRNCLGQSSTGKKIPFSEWFLRPDFVAEQVPNGQTILVPDAIFGGVVVGVDGHIRKPDCFLPNDKLPGGFCYERKNGSIEFSTYGCDEVDSLHVIRSNLPRYA